MNKRLVILFAFLALITLIVVLNFTVFAVKEIDVQNSYEGDWQFDKQKIVKDTLIKTTTNILSVSENKTIKNIEASNPEVKVLNIEKHFPNRITIFITKRVPVVAVKIKDSNQYAIIDSDFYIIKCTETPQNVAIFNGEELALNEISINNLPGTTLSGSGNGQLQTLRILLDACAQINDLSRERFAFFFNSISFEGEHYILLKTNSGITFSLIKQNDILMQIQGCYSIFNSAELSDIQKRTGFLNPTTLGWEYSLEKPKITP
ncbi:MAG: FtsQ-type POTRA domain-containing protein [Clostridia bacterium]